MNKALCVWVIIGTLILSSCTVNEIKEDKVIIEKENNMCASNADCEYIWYTGGCNTPEYVGKEQQAALEKGIFIGEAPSREGVTCTCEENKCVTHG